MSEAVEFITIIRPSFMRFCKDACRAAAFNHILFRIAGKCKDQPKEKIQAGEITWYGSNEQITSEMSHAWGVCKIRTEINALIKIGLFGRSSNPTWGVDRTKHFFFGTEQCDKFLQLCQEHNICVVHLDLCDEVKHLIYSSNANDKSIKCICVNHQMQAMNISDANDKSIEAITIEDNKEEKISQNGHSPNVDAHASLSSLSLFSDSSVTTGKNENNNHFHIADTAQEPQKPNELSSKQAEAKKQKEPLKVKVEHTYEVFDTLFRELMNDPSYKEPRTDKSTKAIKALIQADATDERIRFVLMDIWNDKDAFWQKHRTITSVASQYSTRVSKMKSKTPSGALINGSPVNTQNNKPDPPVTIDRKWLHEHPV